MKKFTLALSAAALLGVSACSNPNEGNTTATGDTSNDGNMVAEGSETDPNPPATTGTAMSAPDFAAALAASDMFEIESSRLALEKAQSADVKKFAQMMVDGHTQTSAKLKALTAGQTPAMMLPAKLPNDKQAIVTRLRATPADGFDAAYMQEQVAAHQATLSMLQGFVASGDHAALKQLSSEMIPIVTSHLEMARKMQGGTQSTAKGSAQTSNGGMMPAKQ